jgi:DNA modification methylase
MEIINLPIGEVKLFEFNAKLHPAEQVEQIKRSILEFGFNDPIAVDEHNVLIEGEGRLLAQREIGAAEIPAIRLSHLNDEQKRAYVLAHNKLTLNSGFDMERLKAELKFLEGHTFDVSLTGFSAAELSDLLNGKTLADVKEDNFDVDKAASEIITPVTQRGDIWLLGNHRLLCGDSTSPDDIARLMAGEKARCIFTDPPWNVDYGADKKHPSWKARQIMNDKMSTEQFGAFLLSAFRAIASVCEQGAMTYVVMSAQEWGNIMPVMSKAGYHWSSTIIWAKDSLVLSRKDYHTQYEPIWCGMFDAEPFCHMDEAEPKYEPVWYGWLGDKRLCPLKDRKQSDLWQIPRPKVSPEHPTMKPVELVARALLNSSRTGDIILDSFGGSGSTCIAAEQIGRAARMMELDAKYCDVIVKRFAAYAEKADIMLERDGLQIPFAEAMP